MKIKVIIPNAFTLCNLALGMMAIIYIFNKAYQISGLLILIAAICDGFDGQLARKLNVTSIMGKELDSLSDLISFGLASALLIWNLKLVPLGVIGIIITITFTLTGAYRLARYNATVFKGVYSGIPITLTGSLLAIISLYATYYSINAILVMGFMLLLSYLMVNTRIKLRKR